MTPDIKQLTEDLCDKLFFLAPKQQIEALNYVREQLHELSPFKSEPVDCVLWVPNGNVEANDYNPNSVAPPEMELLAHSIREDGYTQPIVGWGDKSAIEVVDGFHRNRVGKEHADIRKRVHGYLPVVIINEERTDKTNRMASTVRHNRARGKHRVQAMSDMVIELKRRNWSDERVSRELGMDKDEVLRLCQITGLADIFADTKFSQAWDVEGEITESDFKELTDDDSEFGEEAEDFRAVNTDDPDRIFHTHDKWECQKAGFYKPSKEGMSKKKCEEAYRDFLSDIAKFEKALKGVISEWKHSCEHYLTNKAMNRIAWLGQAAACYSIQVPSEFRSGYYLLTKSQQQKADDMALVYLNKWLVKNNRKPVTMIEALSGDRQSDIY